MQKKTLGLTMVALTSAVALIAVAVGTNKNAISFTRAGTEDYSIGLGAENGAVSGEASIKSAFVTGKTGKGNDVSMKFKNMEAASGKLGKMLKGGVYGNADPITSMTKIAVNSNAGAADGVLRYGSATGNLAGEVDLSMADEFDFPAGTNYFRIETVAEVEIESINIDYDCADYQDGLLALDEYENDTSYYYAYDANPNGEGAMVYNTTNSDSETATLVIPDNVYLDSVLNPVNFIRGKASSWGIAESSSALEHIYLPDGLQEIGAYAFNGASSVKSLTLPYGLTKAGSHLIPSNLETLRIESKNLATASSSSGISTTNSKLKRIEISADVEFLPDIVYAWPSNVTIYYEGTRAMWDELAAKEGTSAKWQGSNLTPDLICADTETRTVTFYFENATLGAHGNAMVIDQLLDGKTLENPGIPTYEGNAKKFDGWYDDPIAGTKIAFPMTIDGDADIYAHFIDWPAGYSIDNPVILGNGVTDPVHVDEVDTTAYFSYTATVDETVLFYFEFANPSIAYATERVKLYDALGQEVTIPGASNTVAKDVAKIAHTDDEFIKIRMEAGEKYTFGLSLYSSSQSKFAEADINIAVAKATAENQLDYTVAKEYELGTTASYLLDLRDSHHAWYTFVAPASGGREMNVGSEEVTNAYASYEIGHFDGEGNWVSLGNKTVTNYSKTNSMAFDMVEGVRYYVVIGTNTNGCHATFSIANSVPEGYDIDNAKAIELGVATPVGNAGQNGTFFRVEATELSMLSVSFTGASSSAQGMIAIYNSEEVKIAEATANKTSSYSSYYSTSLALNYGTPVEGVFYVFVGYATTPSSWTSMNVTVNLATPGSSADTAILVEPDFTGATSLEVKATEAGMFYKFVATENGILDMEIAGLDGVVNTFFGSSLTNPYSVRGNKLRYQVTSGTTYNFRLSGVAGTGNVTFLMNPAETGKSADTAITASLGIDGSMDLTNYIFSNSWEYMFISYTPAEDGVYQITSTGEYTSTLVVYDAADVGTPLEAISNVEGFVAKYQFVGGTEYMLRVKAPGSSVNPFGIRVVRGTAEAGVYHIDNDGEDIVLNLDGFGGGTAVGGNDFSYVVADPFVVEFSLPLVEPDGMTPRTITAVLNPDLKTGTITNIEYGTKVAYQVRFDTTYHTATNRRAFVDNGDGTYTSGNAGVNNSVSEMAIEAMVAGKYSFDYSVSGETGYDYMVVYIVTGGVASKIYDKIGSVAGVSDTISLQLEAGEMIVIAYRKDSSGNQGSDCAVISNIAVETASDVAGSYAIDTGDTVILDGFGTATLDATGVNVEYTDGDPIVITFPYTPIVTEAGTLSRTITVTLDPKTHTGTGVIHEGTLNPISVDLETEYVTISGRSTRAGWQDLGDCYRSDNADVHNSVAEMSITCLADGTLSFEYLVGGEGSYTKYDYLVVMVNGEVTALKANLSPSYNQFEIEVQNGDIVSFVYTKDSSTSNNPDYAEIRNVTLA